LNWHQQHLPTANLLRVVLASAERTPVTDCYLRGADIIISYGDSPAKKNVRPQMYWRLVDREREDARGIELVLSLETDLLQSDPHARIETTFPCQTVVVLTDRGWEPIGSDEAKLTPPHSKPLVVLQGEPWSYAEMIYPGDFTQCTIQRRNGVCQVTWELFQEHLEKGVIRRARARGVFIQSGDSLAAALAALERFENSPLPLTT
jgi:hypothetical protein